MRSYQIWWEVITWELLRQYVHFYSTFVGELISHGITFQMHLKLIFQETFQTDFASKRQLMHGITTQLHEKLILQRIACNVYIFIHEKHEIGSTITNSMVSVVLPWKTGFKYIYGTYDMNMSKVRPIWNVNGEMDWSKWFNT